MDYKKEKLLTVLSLAFSWLVSFTSYGNISSTDVLKNNENKLSDHLELVVGTYYNTDFNPSSYAGHDPSLSLEVSPILNFPEGFKNSLTFEFSQQLGKEELRELKRVEMISSKKIMEISNTSSLLGKILVKAPASEQERKNDSLILGAGASIVFTQNLSSYVVEGLSYSLSQAFVRNFHEYTTKASGVSNVRYSSIQKAYLTYSYEKIGSLLLGVNYFERLNYQNDRLKNRFSLSTQLSTTLNKNLSFIVSYGIGGEATKDNGVDNAITVYDSEKSTLAIGFEYNLK